MSEEEAIRVAKAFAFKIPAIPGFSIRSVRPDYTDGIEVLVTYRPPDRETGATISENHLMRLAGCDLERMTEDHLKHMILRHCESAWMHEFWNSYHYAGVRERDPHAGE